MFVVSPDNKYFLFDTIDLADIDIGDVFGENTLINELRLLTSTPNDSSVTTNQHSLPPLKDRKNNKRKDMNIYAAKIEGGFSESVPIMIQKHKENKRVLSNNVAVIESFGGAEHLQLDDEGRHNVGSFSSQMFCASTLNANVSTASTFNT